MRRKQVREQRVCKKYIIENRNHRSIRLAIMARIEQDLGQAISVQKDPIFSNLLLINLKRRKARRKRQIQHDW